MHYKCLTAISMLYLTIKLMTVLLIYKLISIGPLTTTAATLIIPVWFLLGDVIAEVYGYKISKQVIWIALLCQFVFAFSCAILIKIDSPNTWPYQSAYQQVLGSLPRVAVASFLAVFSGAFINAFLLTKWKKLLNGKYFWLRSLGASAIGEAIFTVVAYLIEFWGVVPVSVLIELTAMSFITKTFVSLLFVTPSTFIAALLKRIEGIDDTKENVHLDKLIVDLKGRQI